MAGTINEFNYSFPPHNKVQTDEEYQKHHLIMAGMWQHAERETAVSRARGKHAISGKKVMRSIGSLTWCPQNSAHNDSGIAGQSPGTAWVHGLCENVEAGFLLEMYFQVVHDVIQKQIV